MILLIILIFALLGLGYVIGFALIGVAHVNSKRNANRFLAGARHPGSRSRSYSRPECPLKQCDQADGGFCRLAGRCRKV